MTMAPASRFLDLAALARLGNLRLCVRGAVEGPYAGRHESVARGGAVEFVDFRPYAPGEDLRRLDWKVLARLRKPYVRTCADETNLLCTIVLDASSSMLFGGHLHAGMSKLDFARHLSAAVAFILMRERDQASLAVCADGLADYLPLGSTPAHLLRFCEKLDAVNPVPKTRMALALKDLFPLVRRRSLLFVMSDFLFDDLDRVFTNLRLIAHQRIEVVLLHIVHPEEETLPKGPAYRFEDLESNLTVPCSPAEVVNAYEAAFRRHVARVSNLAAAGGMEYRYVSMAFPYIMALKDMLVERKG